MPKTQLEAVIDAARFVHETKCTYRVAAEKFGVAQSAICVAYRRAYGSKPATPIVMGYRTRIDRAVELALTSGRTIRYAAGQCGADVEEALAKFNAITGERRRLVG